MFKEINALRKSGKLEEAYNLAIQEYNKNPDDKFIKSAYSWVLYDYIKKCNNINDFEKSFKEFLSLDIESSGEVDIKGIICNILYSFLKQEKNINNYKKLLLYYTKLNLDINSETHKFILIDIFKREKDENFKNHFDLISFIKLVPFDLFKKSYFHEEYKTEDGIKVPTLFEKIITIAGEKIKNSKNIKDLGDVNFLEKLLKYGVDKNGKWSGYYLGKLFLIKGDHDLALKYIIEVVKKEKTQFWSWYLFGEVLLKSGKDDLYFSALSKALSVGKDDNFLNNLRLEYLLELEKKGFEDEANIELNKIIENKTKNGYKIDEELIRLKNKKWFKEDIDGNNYYFYNKYTFLVEEFLYSNIEDSLIYISNINNEKKVINFVNKNKMKGFFKFSHAKNIGINKGDVLKVKIEKIDKEYFMLHKMYDEKFFIQDIFSFEKILIEYINFDKNIINFIGNNKYGFFNFKGFEGVVKERGVGDFLDVIFGDNDGDFFNLLDCVKSEISYDEYFKKEISGIITIEEGNNFGFIDDIYIEGKYLNGLKNGDHISGTAVKTYNKKKNKFGWKILNIYDLDKNHK